MSSRRRLAVDALDVDAASRVKGRGSVVVHLNIALHAPAEVLVEGRGVVVGLRGTFSVADSRSSSRSSRLAVAGLSALRALR